MPGSQYIRKAHSMFGWDWGPQLPDMGIWRNIGLEYRHTAELSDVLISQKHEDGSVRLLAAADVTLLTAAEILISLESPDGEMIGEKQMSVSKSGRISAVSYTHLNKDKKLLSL